jgi:hypothetical protein
LENGNSFEIEGIYRWEATLVDKYVNTYDLPSQFGGYAFCNPCPAVNFVRHRDGFMHDWPIAILR